MASGPIVKALNICIISQEYPPYTNWGGIGVYNNEIAHGYSKLGHDVTIVSRMSKGAPRFEIQSNGVKVYRVGATVLRKKIVGRTVDKIMHAEDVYRKVKELDRLKRFDVIETTEAGLEGKKLIKMSDVRPRMIIQCNGSNMQVVTPEGISSFLHRLDKKWSFICEQKFLKAALNIIVTSEATRKFLLRHGIDGKKIELIYQGIDVARFAPRLKPLESPNLEVGFAGRLEKPKGIDFIWHVIEKIGPNAGIRFHLKGSIHWSIQKETEMKLRKYSKSVIYHSVSEHSQMPKFYHSLHVLLQPSRFENFGLVYAEGMACKLIVFAGKEGGGPEIIRDKVTGFIIDPDNDVDYVVGKLKEIAANPLAFDDMRHKARQEIIKRFSLQTCTSQKIAYYQKVSGKS